MVYYAGRNFIQLKIGQLVGTDHHCTLFLVKKIYNFLQRIFIRIKIIAVQLYRKFTAGIVMNSFIPASADSEISTIGNQVNKLFAAF
jgi:hypothetical protein